MSYVDNVNHPSHYESETSIECIDAMELFMGKEGVIQFCIGNAFKYIWRYKNKGKPGEDLKKAEWYIIRADELNDHLQKTSRFPVDYSTEINRLHDIWSIYYNREAAKIALENDYLYENGQLYKEDGKEVSEDKNIILTWGERESVGNQDRKDEVEDDKSNDDDYITIWGEAWIDGKIMKSKARTCRTSSNSPRKRLVHCPYCNRLNDITDIFRTGMSLGVNCDTCDRRFAIHNSKDDPEINENTGEEMVEVTGDE